MVDQLTDQHILLVWIKTENGSESESETETDLLPIRILHQRGICLGE